jgi:hypothetical protein
MRYYNIYNIIIACNTNKDIMKLFVKNLTQVVRCKPRRNNAIIPEKYNKIVFLYSSINIQIFIQIKRIRALRTIM